MKTKFEQDLDRLEYTVFKHGYNTCITDLEHILSESLKTTMTTTEIILLVKIRKAMEDIEKMRFLEPHQQN